MQVTVSLKIELDATTPLHQMEQQIQEAGRAAMREALKQAIRQHEEQAQPCPACGNTQCQRLGTKRRVLLTSFGRLEVPLQRLRCQPCEHRFRPAEHCLAEVKGHNVTPNLQALAALVGSSWPYEPAAGVLKVLSGVQLSDERVRQLTNEQGSALAKQQQAQAQHGLQEAVHMQQIRAQRAQSAQRMNLKPPEGLQVGRMVAGSPHGSQKAGWKGKSESLLVTSSPSANGDAAGSRGGGMWRRLDRLKKWDG